MSLLSRKKLCLVSHLIPEESAAQLSESFKVFRLPADRYLPSPVASHPDMLVCCIENRLFVNKHYYAENRHLIDEITEYGKLEVCPENTEAEKRSKYPYDATLNIAVDDCRKLIICKPESSFEIAVAYAKDSGFSVIPVKQGYSACSCIITDSGIITSDPGIASVLRETGVNCCLVPNSDIRLKGYDMGLIGGCGGYDSGIVYLLGSLNGLESEIAIKSFAHHYGYIIKELSERPLEDYGGIKFI